MRVRHFAAVFAASTSLFSAPMAAQASMVTFSFDTTVSNAVNGPNFTWPSTLAVGNPLGIDVSFDTAAPLLRTDNDGNGNASIFTFSAASLSMTAHLVAVPPVTRSFANWGDGLIRMRDNALDPDGNGDLVDGITFTLTNRTDPNVVTSWNLVLRGPVLDLFSGPNLPSSQDARWNDLRGARFVICRSGPNTPDSCDQGYMRSLVNHNVPEPASALLALLGLGVAGVARRRWVSGPVVAGRLQAC